MQNARRGEHLFALFPALEAVASNAGDRAGSVEGAPRAQMSRRLWLRPGISTLIRLVVFWVRLWRGHCRGRRRQRRGCDRGHPSGGPQGPRARRNETVLIVGLFV